MRITKEQVCIIMLILSVLVASVAVVNSVRRERPKQDAHGALAATMESCPPEAIKYQTSSTNDGGVAWFTMRCEVTK